MSESWAIGIYGGRSPLELAPLPGLERPVLSAADVSDLRARFVADPFMLHTGDRFAMWFEVLDHETELGHIAWAESHDGLHWRYQGAALRESFHLSYPFVFAWQGQYYMIPETLGAGCVRLYEAKSFPNRWRHVADLIDGELADPTIIRAGDRWWMLGCPRPYQHDCLSLHMADDLRGPWVEHPASLLIDGDPENARPAGRPVLADGRLLRFAQDCRDTYGAGVRAFEITTLEPDRYEDRPLGPLLGRGAAGPVLPWATTGMHHVDAHQLGPDRWIACVDGNAG